ncbi:MAG: magnesium transporter [Sedimenticolaceae bacterium]|nr:magnesium transporter [Sedimenticolaceae bacterium]
MTSGKNSTSNAQTSREDLLESFHAAFEQDDMQRAGHLLKSLHPSEIADALEAIPWDQRPALWEQVETSLKGEVLLQLGDEVRQQLIESTGENELLTALQSLEMDELADLDARLPIPVVDAMVRAMDAQSRSRYEAVRDWPDNTAGGLMDVDAAVVRSDVTMRSVIRYLRQLRARVKQLPEHLDSLVVVDRDNNYLGMLMLSDLVSLDPETPVSDSMLTDIRPIPVDTAAERVMRLFEDQDLLSAPVVDESGKLLGRITVDDVMDVMRDAAEHEVMSRAGLSQGTDIFAPVLPSAMRRAVWLGVNLVNAFIAAWVIGLFEDSIDKVVALAVLMPVVASMGGVAGTQTLTLVTRGLALEQVRRSNAGRLLLREIASGLLNGFFWSVVVAIVAITWTGDVRLGVVFGAALVINLLTGATAGTLVPLLLQRLGIDPALAGGVVLIAATDVVGFLSFLGLATLFVL